jgi:recombination protein RecT
MVPFNNSKKGCKEATFQLGYRGYIQLAMRSGQYQKINATDIREGELKSYNPITDEYVFDPVLNYEERGKLPVIGYYGYFILNNGYKKEIYWDKARMEAHAKKYSASYRKGWDSFWKSDFDEMARKTIIRQLISKWGVMSVDMEKAYTSDMAVIRDDGSSDYIDNVPDTPTEFKDVLEEVDGGNVTEIKEDGDNE